MPTFPLPAGFQPPDEAVEGQDFDEVATFSITNGAITLKAIGGVPVDDAADAAEETAEEAPPEEGGDFMSAVESRMSGAT